MNTFTYYNDHRRLEGLMFGWKGYSNGKARKTRNSAGFYGIYHFTSTVACGVKNCPQRDALGDDVTTNRVRYAWTMAIA